MILTRKYFQLLRGNNFFRLEFSQFSIFVVVKISLEAACSKELFCHLIGTSQVTVIWWPNAFYMFINFKLMFINFKRKFLFRGHLIRVWHQLYFKPIGNRYSYILRLTPSFLNSLLKHLLVVRIIFPRLVQVRTW